MRCTEYHAGVAVIRDKSKLKEAMAKLARLEDMTDLPTIMCDEYCRYPREVADQDKLIEGYCKECKLVRLFREILD